ncbi:hypothetical protein N7493_005392 [Penicillium malachiteum]|uniref:Uncharacterized protein n=1 Tax=Penicillium malachiteum TaxID=1324776 RepID=A0AAD6MWS6_9EURO|nr:hypothetical protein N7493_005392 [Penicillium malachiteum]
MRASWFLASTLATLVAAKASSTTISYLGVSITGSYAADFAQFTSLAADVYAIDKTATTYDIRCEDGAPISVCAIDSKTPWRMIQGPETYSISIKDSISTEGVSADVTANVACSFTHTSESVSCSQYVSFTISASEYSTAWSTNAPSYTIDADQVSYVDLKVTGGLQAFSADATATSPVTVSSSDAAQPIATAAPLMAAAAAAIAALL